MTDQKRNAEWAIFKGRARLNSGKLFLDLGSDKPLFEIFPEGYGQIKAVPADIKHMLGGVEYYLPLTVEDIPKNAKSLFTDTGFKWPFKLV